MKAKDLKNSILQMAVEGKLVSQDPADESASVLLERIREERRRLIAEKKIKAPKGGESIIYRASDGSRYEKRVDAKGRESEPVCIDGEIPFEVPDGWEWARLGSLFAKMGSGSTPTGGRKVYKSEGPMLIRSQNVHNDGLRLDDVARFDHKLWESRSSHVLPHDMLLNITGASIGRCAVVPSPFEEADVNQHVLIMRPLCMTISRFVQAAITSSVIQKQIMSSQVGATKEGLSATSASRLLIPLPPLAEQRRIVAKVEELMPLVEEYGELEDEREALDANLPDRLRKSVLQEAVRGRLVPQDPSDEPASALLGRVRAERAAQVAAGKLKAPKGGESVIYRASDGAHYEKRGEAEPVCIEGEIPFEAPESWEWARLGSVASFGGGGTPDKNNPLFWGGDIPWASMKDMHGKYLTKTIDTITDKGLASKSSISICKPGQVIVSTRLAPGKSIISQIECAINQDLKVVRSLLRADYLSIWFESCLEYFKRIGSGTTVPGIKLADIEAILVPIPSLAEQQRIVAKIDEILSLLT